MRHRQKTLTLAVGGALAGLSLTATAETVTGVTAPYYDPGSFGAYYPAAGGYAGALYQYAVGVKIGTPVGPTDAPTVTIANGFGDSGDRWTVRGDEHFMDDRLEPGHQFKGVGTYSWCAAGTCSVGSGRSVGRDSKTQKVLFAVATEADIRISLSNAPSVEGADGPGELETGALGDDLMPGYTLFEGISDQGWGYFDATFTNMADYTPFPLKGGIGQTITVVPAVAPDLIYLAHDANTANANSISNVYHLTPGLYSLWLGANIANSANTDEDLACLTQANGHCTGYSGIGKNFQLAIETAAVPLPAAGWLFGGGLAGLWRAGRTRRKQA